MISLTDRWKSIRERVAEAAVRNGRDPSEVTIVGVSKYVDAEKTRELVEAGCRDLGESRPQVLWEKAELLQELTIRWHLIGHLQRNKSKRTVPLLDCLHSIDSTRLAEQVNLDAAGRRDKLSILLEVNISGDASKTGLPPGEVLSTAEKILELPNLRLDGLMGMAGLGNQTPREDFAELRRMRDRLQTQLGSQVELRHLSMGMSGDFEEAVAEGATMLRIGSILFETE